MDAGNEGTRGRGVRVWDDVTKKPDGGRRVPPSDAGAKGALQAVGEREAGGEGADAFLRVGDGGEFAVGADGAEDGVDA